MSVWYGVKMSVAGLGVYGMPEAMANCVTSVTGFCEIVRYPKSPWPIDARKMDNEIKAVFSRAKRLDSEREFSVLGLVCQEIRTGG